MNNTPETMNTSKEIRNEAIDEVIEYFEQFSVDGKPALVFIDDVAGGVEQRPAHNEIIEKLKSLKL